MSEPPAFPNSCGSFPRLRDLLQQRLALIADQVLRERDPAGQFAELRRVSEEIAAFHQEHRSQLPARLNHFLERASFQKALEFIGSPGA